MHEMQRQGFGMTQRSALHMTRADVVAHATKNRLPVPPELVDPGPGKLFPRVPRKGDRRLKKHREANETEKKYGLILEAMRRRGEIVYAGFEEITLRWADMEYTPDYFVIRQLAENHTEAGGGPLIEAVYIELKGGRKWEDSIVKFKAARARFSWARFEMWALIDGTWTQLA